MILVSQKMFKYLKNYFIYLLYFYFIYFILYNCLKRRFSFIILVRSLLSFNIGSNTFVKFLAKVLSHFTLNNLFYVIQQLTPQNRPRHRYFSSFSKYIFDIHICRTWLWAQLLFLARTSRLVFTCYKVNSSHSKDGFNSPSLLKKDLFPTVFNA